MRRLLYSFVALGALGWLALAPTQARASWLSEALHAYFGPSYYGSTYFGPDDSPAPAYPYYAPGYTGYPYDYTNPYRSYYSSPGYVAPAYSFPRRDRDAHRWHEWHEWHHGYEHRGHHR